MAEDAPNSSWHPAFMPNRLSTSQEQKTSAAPQIDAAQRPDVRDEATTPTISMIPDATLSHDSADAWMTGDGDDSDDPADAWLMSEDPTLQSIDVDAPQRAQAAQPLSEEPAHIAEAAPLSALTESIGEAQDATNPANHVLPEKQTAAHAFDTQDDAADAWLSDELVQSLSSHLQDPVHDDPVATPVEQATAEPEVHAQVAPEHNAGAPSELEPEAAPKPEPAITESDSKQDAKGAAIKQPLSQHSSSMSFTRTVSHEISFNDDDESEWTPPRSDTDPFKFMPPSDRTNSFPAVPPARSAEDAFPSHPLPSAQALDVVEEVEKSSLTEDPERETMFWQNDGTAESPQDSSQTFSGEIGDAATEAFQSRFEQGSPLIPAAPESIDQKAAQPPANTFANFGEDDNDDDFFSQTKQDEPSEDSMQPIQRKSAMQVIGDTLNREPTLRQPGFDALEEHAEEEQHSQALADSFAAAVEDESQPDGTELRADLSAKWQEAFATGDSDDDFLLDDAGNEGEPFDTAGFLGSDDEGLLLDDDDDVPATTTAQAPATKPYLPTQTQTVSTPATSHGYTPQLPQQTPYGGVFGYAPASQQRPEVRRTESFADKAKGGYASPYDLPTDLVTAKIKPRKRQTMPHIPQEPIPPSIAAPPRSASAFAPPPASGGAASAPPTTTASASQPPPSRSASRQEGFFEDLPMTKKPRPASRQSLRAASPSKPYGSRSPTETAPAPVPPPMNQRYQPSPAESPAVPQNVIPNLVAPPKVNPYAALQTAAVPQPAPAPNATRYSPAPAQQAKGASAPPPAASNRFSPAPPLPRQTSSPTQTATASASQTYLHHLPRTSSPLAQFEIHHDKATAGTDAHFDKRASSHYEPRLNRVASLPPTREVDEEDETQTGIQPAVSQHQTNAAAQQMTTAPPSQLSSPQKRSTSNYLPHAIPQQPNFAPPARSQTHSPGATRNKHHQGRPTSAHSPAVPPFGQASQPTNTMPVRTRGASMTMNMVPPTDGREHDPLQRWQGVPIISWGVGGAMVTSFPKSTPRYTVNQSAPTMLRTPGEVKVKNMKEIEPLPEQLAKFPGPLRGKSKKKDALAWLASGITALEKELPDISLHPQLSLEAKRSIERLLLWKILRVFIEFDGHLEGLPSVEKAVREILSPQGAGEASLPAGSSFSDQAAHVTGMRADDVNSASMESIRDSLLKGDRESAVWSAVDKRLWGHAMLIAHTTSPELYSRVAQEFVRKEVNYPGHSNQSLGAFYKILSGNFEDCVDELVPVHARAGLQLISTDAGTGPTQDALGGLDKWRETVSLVLSNRSDNDIRGLNALGKLLSGYGRAEAAQICFIFSRTISVFGGIDDANADFVLVGADHHKQSDQFGKETEALQLSEVYEYGLTLSGAASLAAGAPHLAGYKLQHATTLAEHGYRDKALQYCDSILSSMSAQTRRLPYHHVILETAVDNFMRRLKQAPKDDGSNWMSKPSMNKVSDSMWNRFNKFVSGDEDANGQNGGDSEHGPFAHIASTPNMSRSPSVSNFETYGTSPSYTAPGLPAQASTATSRYAPAATPAAAPMQNPYESVSQHAAPIQQQQQQQHTNGRASNEYSRGSYEPVPLGAAGGDSGYPGFGQGATQPSYQPSQPVAFPYQPQAASATAQPYGLQPAPSITADASANVNYGYQGYQPAGYESSRPAASSTENSPKIGNAAESGYQPLSTQSYGYEPPLTQAFGYAPPAMQSRGYEPPSSEPQGYEPPSTQSYGYEPPSYQPDMNNDAQDDDTHKPKKKSFMDDDEDKIPVPQPAGTKSKAEMDRENEEMFKKVAEQEAKQAAEAAAAKKGAAGWGFGGWFGGGKKADLGSGEAAPNKAIRAKLGESNSFVYDPELKRWINKKPGAEQTEAPKASPPPPRGVGPRSVSGTPPPSAPGPPLGLPRSASTSNIRMGISAPPPSGLGISSAPPMTRADSNASTAAGAPTPSSDPTPSSEPPSRPTTSISNASSIDDLLGTAGPRKAGGKKPRKAGRYVDVMAK